MEKLRRRFRRHDRTSRSQLRRFTRSKAGTFFFFLFIFMAGAVSVLPLIYSICTSLKPLDELLVFPPRFFVHNPTLQNYKVLPELLSNLKVPITRYVYNSLFTTVIGTFLNVVFSTMAAFVLSKSKLRYKNVIFIIVQFSLMFSAYTLEIPRYLIYNGMNIMDSYWMYILPAIPSATSVFLMKQYMDGYIPNDLMESAELDGASFWRIYWQIIVPMVKPAFLTIALFAFRDIWAMMPSGTIFSEELKTLPMIVNQITAGGIARSGSAMAVSVILMIPPIIVYFCTQSNVMETMNSAGIKG